MRSGSKADRSAFDIAADPIAARASAPAWAQPVAAYAAALVLLIWACAAVLIYFDEHVHRSRAERDVVNLARIAERSAFGVVDGLDRRLRFLRWVELNQKGGADWPRLLADRTLVDGDGLQIAVVDANGLVFASSLDTAPSKLVDISDRPHFAAQRDSAADELSIGPVVVGRMSQRRSLQFTRKRLDAAGHFAGAFVSSLPVEHFAAELANLNLPVGGGLALVGDDGIVRAGVGVFSYRIGEPYSAASLGEGGYDSSWRVGTYPLTAVSHLPPIESDPGWRMRRGLVVCIAVGLTVAALFVTLYVVRRRRRVETELLTLSRRDALTGLANRRSFSEALAALSASEGPEFALHVLDLDRFKAVNDTYGHPVGDELLKLAAARLAKLVGPDDMVARLGGDEFAILQKTENFEQEALPLARKVNRAMAQSFATSRVTVSIGATVGVARGRRDGANAVELMQAADLALYAAKADGRGGARVFRREMTETATQRIKVEAGLRGAIAAGELFLAYQPVRSLKRDHVTGYEALLRWRPAGGETLTAGQFIGIAEDVGLIVEIGAWALSRACKDIAALPGDPEACVNVSPMQLESGALAGQVAEALRESGLAPFRLRIELTEAALLNGKAIVADQVRALRDLGVGVSLDDFGAGFASLSYLEQHPIDTLKIDRRLVAKIGARAEAVSTLRAIVDLARSFGMKTVAEGVETEEQLEALRTLGCTRAQGYYLGRPGELPKAPASRAA